MIIHDVETKPDHSYVLMCNHVSFWDGMWAIYLYRNSINKRQQNSRLYIMTLKKQMDMNPWLKYFGSFSVAPGMRSVSESLAFAANILNTPGNVLLMYPQGNLESLSVRDIVFNDGIREIVNQVEGNCQLLWSSNFVEYFESLKPSIFYHMLDCGTNESFDFDDLKKKINIHHKESMKKQFRFTED